MWFWVIRGHATEGLRWYEQILDLSSLPPRAESRTLTGAARMSYTRGDLDAATVGLTRILTLARSVDDLDTVGQAENQLGHIERKRGNFDAARDRFTRSVEIFRARAIAWGTGSALHGLANVALATGDVARAERLLDEATVVLRNAGPWFLTLGAYTRGVLAVRRGNADEAIKVMRESLTGIWELHDKFAFVYALVPLAAAAVLKGDDAWAARLLGARNAVTDRTGATVVDSAVDDLRDQVEREARARLGPDRWTRAYAAGRVGSIDSLIRDIDTALSVRGPTE